MIVGMVSVYCQLRELSDQLDALSEADLQIIFHDTVIIAGQSQNASCHGIHQVFAGCFHDHVPRKIGRHLTALYDNLSETRESLLIRHLAHQKQIDNLIIAQLISRK